MEAIRRNLRTKETISQLDYFMTFRLASWIDQKWDGSEPKSV